jgi:hypothetical protein
MARGRQPSPDQLVEERAITLQAATEELVSWDRREAELLAYLAQAPEVANNQTLSAIVRRLQRGDLLENADHAELYEAVHAG